MTDWIETNAWVITYKKGDLGEIYHQETGIGKAVLVSSVDAENLVSITVPGGISVIVKASQLITAIQKCVM